LTGGGLVGDKAAGRFNSGISMSRFRLVLLPIAALALFACGGPKAGDSCNQTGFLCADDANALECRVGTWTQLPCRGSGGCKRDGSIIRCDMSGNQAGDTCASTAEGKGLCNSTGTGTLECRNGVLVATNTCKTCTVSGEQVVCTP
jgi:hypothetical protein